MPHTALLLVELGAVLLGLGLLGRLAGRLGLSPIPLYLLSGLAFGEGGVWPLVTAQEFIEVGAEIGVVLLLLLLGLEYSASELVGTLRQAAPAGLVDLALNFTPGLAAGFLLGWGPLAAIVLGGVTYISSSGVIAKLLGDLGRYGNRETPVVLSVLVLEDLVMAAYLPVLTVVLAGETLTDSALPVLLALATVAVILAGALRYGAGLSRLVFSPNDEALLLKVLGITMLVAGIAEGLRVSAAVGAFLVGIALSGPAADSARALLTPLRDLFAAVFFVFFGLRTDPGAIPPVLPAVAGLAALTIATKMLTGWWAARRAGIARPGRWRAATTLIARGEFSVVIAGLAVTASTHPQLEPLAATYVLLLAVVGSLAPRLPHPRALRLRRRAPQPSGALTPLNVASPAAEPPRQQPPA